MVRYIKATPKVAEYLGLTGVRNKVKDGNYLLWQADMLRFAPLTDLADTLAKIGAVSLTPAEAKQEQDGKLSTALPTATDSQFQETSTDSSSETSADSADSTTETTKEE